MTKRKQPSSEQEHISDEKDEASVELRVALNKKKVRWDRVAATEECSNSEENEKFPEKVRRRMGQS
jgi:hypothetical protein